MLTSESKGESIGPAGLASDASASTSLETQLSSQFKRQIEILEQRNAKLEKEAEDTQA